MKKMIKFKLIAALIAVMMLLIFANANGQGIKISALPTLTSPDSSADYIPIVHSGTTYKVTPGKLFFEFGASGGGGGSLPDTEIGFGTGSGITSSDLFTFDETASILSLWQPALADYNLLIDNAAEILSLKMNNSGFTNVSTLEFNNSGANAESTWSSTVTGSNAGETRITMLTDGSGPSLSSMTHRVDGYDILKLTDNSTQFLPKNTSTNMLEMFELASNGTNYTGFQSPTSRSTSLIYTLPTTDPSSGDVMVAGTPGGGVVGLTWATLAGAAGDDGEIQFNDGDAFASSTDLFFIDGTSTLGTVNFFAQEVLINSNGVSAGNTGELRFAELATNGTSYVGFKSNDSRSGNLIYVLPATDPTSGQVLSAGAPSAGVSTLSWTAAGGAGTVTSIATTSPITGGTITTTGTIGISDALADGSTKGAASFSISDFNATSGNITIDYNNGTKAAADGSTLGFATFTAADFNSSAGLMSIDYTNAQSASTSTKGFLTDTDWDTFNDKLAATGTMTGATTQRQDFTNGIGTGLIDDDATSEVIFTISTVQKASLDATGFGLIDGAAANPSYSWSNDKTTGFYLKTATSELGAAVNGSLVGGFNTSGLFTNTISEQTAAAGVTIDGVLLKDGLVLGQYGGTGVNNSGKTITLGGNLTTSGAHATTFTTTGTTGVTLPTTGTLATLAGTETFTNKSIVGTQLTGTSYTFAANNTGSTAAYTLQPYEDHDLATYSGTVSWNSGSPSSITSQQYAWSRIGNTVTLFFSIFYGTPGTTNTSAIITLPSDCPTPAVFAAAGDAASEYMYPINGGRVEANMTGNPSAIRGGLRKNSSNNGYEVALIFGSVSAAQCQFTISYRTQ